MTTIERTEQGASKDSTVDSRAITPVLAKVDIEHVEVANDPRKWPKAKKLVILSVISGAAMVAGLGVNIYNPAISEIESDLHATSGQIALSLSLFIIIQGGFPLIWSAISEVYGRKKVYIVSLALCTLGCIVAATAKTIGVLIGMRCLQGAGSSAVISIGAATLADIYDPHERGTMMGIYYCAPLLGPAIGSILGGALTQAFNWRATFWFLAIFTGLCFIAVLFIPDTFRRERSLTYQLVLKRLTQERDESATATRALSSRTSTMTQKTAVGQITPMIEEKSEKTKVENVEQNGSSSAPMSISEKDIEAQIVRSTSEGDTALVQEIKLSLKDVNPVRPVVVVLLRMNNLAILFASGLIFAFSYSIMYTGSRTLANDYGYDALDIGLVLLSFGIGSILGSVIGGRWSDFIFNRLKSRNGGVSSPEMRLESTKLFMIFLPASVIAYGWICEKHVNVAAICVFLFCAGFFSICIYSSTLAYIVDANVGRSSSAVATNSCFRGAFAFVAAEIAVPLQMAIGDGGLYSLWAGLLLISQSLILLVWWKGDSWRRRSEVKESNRQQ